MYLVSLFPKYWGRCYGYRSNQHKDSLLCGIYSYMGQTDFKQVFINTMNAMKGKYRVLWKCRKGIWKGGFLWKTNVGKWDFTLKWIGLELYASFFRGHVVNGCASYTRIPRRDLESHRINTMHISGAWVSLKDLGKQIYFILKQI